jgi:hypothetical protein
MGALTLKGHYPIGACHCANCPPCPLPEPVPSRVRRRLEHRGSICFYRLPPGTVGFFHGMALSRRNESPAKVLSGRACLGLGDKWLRLGGRRTSHGFVGYVIRIPVGFGPSCNGLSAGNSPRRHGVAGFGLIAYSMEQRNKGSGIGGQRSDVRGQTQAGRLQLAAGREKTIYRIIAACCSLTAAS